MTDRKLIEGKKGYGNDGYDDVVDHNDIKFQENPARPSDINGRPSELFNP